LYQRFLYIEKYLLKRHARFLKASWFGKDPGFSDTELQQVFMGISGQCLMKVLDTQEVMQGRQSVELISIYGILRLQ
jgi:hypothetical protein